MRLPHNLPPSKHPPSDRGRLSATPRPHFWNRISTFFICALTSPQGRVRTTAGSACGCSCRSSTRQTGALSSSSDPAQASPPPHAPSPSVTSLLPSLTPVPTSLAHSPPTLQRRAPSAGPSRAARPRAAEGRALLHGGAERARYGKGADRSLLSSEGCCEARGSQGGTGGGRDGLRGGAGGRGERAHEQ